MARPICTACKRYADEIPEVVDIADELIMTPTAYAQTLQTYRASEDTFLCPVDAEPTG